MKTIKDYISTFSESTQEKLWQIYNVIQTEAKGAEQTISYGLPKFKTNGKPLVYFAGYKNHI